MGWEGSPISPWGDTGLTLSQNQAPVTRELGAQRTPRDRRTKDQGYFTHKCPLPQIYPETRNLENQTQKFSKEKDLKKKKTSDHCGRCFLHPKHSLIFISHLLDTREYVHFKARCRRHHLLEAFLNCLELPLPMGKVACLGVFIGNLLGAANR